MEQQNQNTPTEHQPLVEPELKKRVGSAKTLAHEEQPWIEGTTTQATPDATDEQPADGEEVGGKQPSTAQNASTEETGTAALGYDSPPITSSDISNTEVAGYDHAKPYYPPGGGGKELERSKDGKTPQRDLQDKPVN